MFGKTKKEKEEKIPQIPALPQVKIYEKPKEEPEEQVEAQEKSTGARAKIIAIESIEGGFFRSVILSNKLLGKVGEEFPLDD